MSLVNAGRAVASETRKGIATAIPSAKLGYAVVAVLKTREAGRQTPANPWVPLPR
jgi:hypothetical protein